MTTSTNQNGCSFLSYRRSRLHEAKLLIEAQHELGIPTWQDIKDLDEGPTETEIRATLADPDTANAILWLTPEVQDSDFIQRIEAPLILRRYENQDGFFVIPVAAGGLDYSQAAALGSALLGHLGIAAFKGWNIRSVTNDPIQYEDAVTIAGRVLERRIKAIHKALPPGEPLRISLYTRVRAPSGENSPLSIDWKHCFLDRETAPEIWSNRLLPALRIIVDKLQAHAHGRSIKAEGFCAIPAALALGAAFLAPRGIKISWVQKKQGSPDQVWTLDAPRKPSGFGPVPRGDAIDADDLAVLVSVTGDARLAFEASRSALPPFRAIVIVSKAGGVVHDLAEPGQAVDVARIVDEAIRSARQEYPFRGHVHLFIAGPVGLAMLIGQLLNTWGPVQTYEHIPSGGSGHYRAAALLEPIV